MRIRLALLTFLLWILTGGPVLAAEPPDGTDTAEPAAAAQRQLEAVDTAALETFLKEVSQTWEGYGPEISLRDFLQAQQSGEDSRFSLTAILSGLIRYLIREVVANAGLLARLVLLAIVAALLQQMQSAFASEATGKLAQTVVYLALVGLAVTGFGLAITTARQAMDQLAGFMLAMLPTLLAVLAGIGGVTSAALFHSLLMTLTSAASSLMVTVVFPLIFLSAVLDVVSGLHDQLKLTGLAGLLRQVAMYTLSLMFTVFLGLSAVKGTLGAITDGLSVKTAKFAISSFVPVVGKMFSDASELILGSGVLLKNALGMVGLAAVFFITIFPLLKILSLVAIYQLAAAAVQPVGADQIARMLNTMARSLQMVFAAVAVVALMFFLGITAIVGAGNAAMMVR
ncbi:MAG TPA: stage III sporulation protein AE [Symbiobacteriaceae bacterium]